MFASKLDPLGVYTHVGYRCFEQDSSIIWVMSQVYMHVK